MTIRTKTELIAAMQENPAELLQWSIMSSGKNGVFTFRGDTVLARAANSVIGTDIMYPIKRGASWNTRSWRFLGTD